MTMPLNLIVVRHGESEGNVANRASRNGDNTRFEHEAFRERHSSHWRLSEKGIAQAYWAGENIRSLGMTIGRKYSSPYLRALETMGHLNLGGPNTMIVYGLRERSWGELDRMTHEKRMKCFGDNLRDREKDPLQWQPPGGESLVSRMPDIRDWMGTLSRECSEMKCVVATCHAETAEIIRVTLERMSPERYVLMRGDKAEDIWNCSLLHYTRENPFNPGVPPHPYMQWVRLVTPPEAHAQGAVGFHWQEIIRPTFSDEELLVLVEKVAPRILY